MSNPFYRLAPFIQEFIYRNRWDELRDVQVRTLSAVFDTPDHVLIASGTASGKTEAAMFPVLTELDRIQPQTFGALYIGPLKALINDQFERISGLLRDQDIPLVAWHGDRSQSEKARGLKHPGGVLQITPESLEALLMNRAGDIPRLFGELRFVIIDEIHAFMGQDRGLQMQCQLVRLSRLCGCQPRRIGLSATISDYGAAMRYLAAGTNLGVQLIESREGGRQLNLAMEHFIYPPQDDEPQWQSAQAQCNDYLYRLVQNRKCIVFTNSRSDSETCVTAMREIASKRGEPDIFHVHHGSISASLRRDTELSLRDAPGPAVAAATRTLELGIDLGGLERVVQLGAPFTCSSFVQRLGRSGRRGAASQMRFITTSEQAEGNVFQRIPWELIQNIAIVQLYLEDRWVEPFSVKPCPYSLLFHQTLSHLAQSELTPSELAHRVLTLPPFGAVSNEDYRELLRHLLDTDMIQRTDEGGLIVGLSGERLTNSYHFYAVFQDSAGYHVFHKQQELGELDAPPAQDDIIMLAGRKWHVLSVDEDRKHVYVERSSATKPTVWISADGFDLHDRVVQRMRLVLQEDTQYPYLLERARDELAQARTIAREADILASVCSQQNQCILLHPWIGTRKHATLNQLLKGPLREPLDIQSVDGDLRQFYTEVRCSHDPDAFLSSVSRDIQSQRAEDIAPPPNPQIDCYDRFLPDSLLVKAYRHNAIDVDGVKRVVEQWSPESK